MKRGFIAFSLLLAAGVAVHAQEGGAVTLVGETFNESYDATSAVSGGVVAGVRLGAAVGKVALDNIRLAGGANGIVCVRTMTRDGRFNSDNRYRFKDGEEQPSPPLSPVTRRFAKALAAYDAGDFAVNAFTAVGEDCIINEAVHLPQIVGARTERAKLFLLVNSSSRATVLKGPGIAGEVLCEPVAQGARIAYDHECVADVAGLPEGEATFTISMDDGFAPDDVAVKVFLPAVEIR